MLEVKAERNVQVREVYERLLKMDAEAHGIDAMSAGLAQVCEDMKKLGLRRRSLVCSWRRLKVSNSTLSLVWSLI